MVAVIRACIIYYGDVAVAATIKPKYLNCSTCLNSIPSSEIEPEQFTNKTSVLLILIARPLLTQNY